MTQYFYSYYGYDNGKRIKYGHGSVTTSHGEAFELAIKQINHPELDIHFIAFNKIN